MKGKYLFLTTTAVIVVALTYFLSSNTGTENSPETREQGRVEPNRKSSRPDRPSPTEKGSGITLDMLLRSERKSIERNIPNNPAELKRFQDAYSALANLGAAERKEEFSQLLVSASMSLSLEDLNDLCSDFTSIGDIQGGLRELGSRYAAEDPKAGIKWLKSLPSDGISETAFAEFGANLPRQYADDLYELARNCENKNNASKLLMAFGSGAPDFAAAQKIVEVINEDPNLSAISADNMNQLTLGFTREGDIAGALEIASKIKANAGRETAYLQIVRAVANEDPSEAADIILKFPSENDRVSSVSSVVNEWLRVDPEKVSGWVSALPQGRLKDTATESVSRELLTLDPGSSLDWAMNIGSPKMRKAQIAKVLEHAKHSMPDQFEALKTRAEGASLPAGEN